MIGLGLLSLLLLLVLKPKKEVGADEGVTWWGLPGRERGHLGMVEREGRWGRSWWWWLG